MGERLNEAEINENVTSLHEGNEFNLEGAMMKCFNWTPLHVAASRGQQELFQKLLHSNPELAKALDSQQQSLLHLASANGHIEILKALIQVIPEMCLARDRDGANPLHVAAKRGKLEVLDELFKANPHAARARVDKGERETILHLCVKYNQLKFLSILSEKYFKGEEFVNAKDNVGNTILHLAIMARRFEIIEYILNHTEIDVNAINACNQTAMDILLLGQKKGSKPEGVDKDIEALLQNYHAKRVDFLIDPTETTDKRNGFIVAAVLMATLAFQAGVAPPGGVWQDDSDGHKSGGAVMASNYPRMYEVFLYCNLVGFSSSLGTLVLVLTDLPFKKRRYLLLAAITIGTTITSIAIAYALSLVVVSPVLKPDRRIMRLATVVECILSLTLAALMVLFLLKKKRRNRAAETVNRISLTNQA